MKTDKYRIRIYLAVFMFLLLVAISGFMYFEKMSLIDAVYFSIVTMATVGYGDIHPQTEMGKILAILIIIGGVGTFLGVIASITDLFVNRREEHVRQQKVDMVTGLFFSEMGNELLKSIIRFDPDVEYLSINLKNLAEWGNADFDNAHLLLNRHRFMIDSGQRDISGLMKTLQTRSDLLLSLLENPFIQEHENFTELLRALFHLRDEFLHRDDLNNLVDSDRKHLEIDIARVYSLLILEWLRYIRYLKKYYGYLYSLAIRLNPFDPEATAVVKKT